MLCELVGEEGIGICDARLDELMLLNVGEVLLEEPLEICCSLAERIDADLVRIVLDGTEAEIRFTDELRLESDGDVCEEALLR